MKLRCHSERSEEPVWTGGTTAYVLAPRSLATFGMTTQRKLAVVAFGGNALLRPEDRGTHEEQIARAKQAARWLAELVVRGFHLIVVHGNGPQVGNILIQAEEASTKVPPQSLDVAVAQTEGSMGFLLQQAIRN